MSEFASGPQDWVGAWSEKRAALTPDRDGLVDATTGERYTYADLDRRANRTARLLREYGVEDGGRVAVVSRNRPEVVDLFFATGKTGGVLAPLSHRLAPPELGELLARVDPGLLVVETPFLGDVREATAEAEGLETAVLAVEAGDDDSVAESSQTYADELPADDSSVETATLSPEDPHLLLHTGGSTGTPKETVVTHRGVVWNSLNTITAWGLRDDDVTPMVFPMFHTGGWNVVTVPLWHMGGTVVVAREFDPGELLRVIDDEGGSVLVAVPAVLRMMTDHEDWDETDLSTLRFVKSGGGPCRQSVMETWWDRGVDLSQGYGLTECGPNNFAMPEGWPREKADAVGTPAMHVDARIVEGGEPVEPGDIGELQLRSPHAADGYLDNPEETEATFGSGWVATGDLARVDEDGYYYVEGRKKDMFVSGGENVYPAEVEDAIADHDAVAECVVVPVPDDQWGQVGKAVVELTAGAEAFSLDALRSFLDGRLARFKHPQHLAFVDEMPTSGPEKIDRQAVTERFGE
ncbi:AMP-binding protein [Halomicroarcula sp. F13]|uniref:AMP-binding protein n=1 Tax=Haloarcula rubra TaxID=2487747 RepID=A0AAW4PSH7_9EURY|nr:AMP-binding protein [Halomicroarcula rubra]MBX0323242.1 AMP-binding protein [Halomicroarcula rubra]